MASLPWMGRKKSGSKSDQKKNMSRPSSLTRITLIEEVKSDSVKSDGSSSVGVSKSHVDPPINQSISVDELTVFKEP